MFCRKSVPRNFAKFTESLFNKVAGLFFNKVAGLRPAALLKMRLWHKCFSVNLVKFSRTPLQNTSGRKLLKLRNSNTFLHIYLLQKKNWITENYWKQKEAVVCMCIWIIIFTWCFCVHWLYKMQIKYTKSTNSRRNGEGNTVAVDSRFISKAKKKVRLTPKATIGGVP